MANREDWISDGRLLIVSIVAWHVEFSRRFAVELLIGEPQAMVSMPVKPMNFEESTQ